MLNTSFTSWIVDMFSPLLSQAPLEEFVPSLFLSKQQYMRILAGWCEGFNCALLQEPSVMGAQSVDIWTNPPEPMQPNTIYATPGKHGLGARYFKVIDYALRKHKWNQCIGTART